jgi:hypothetical protein
MPRATRRLGTSKQFAIRALGAAAFCAAILGGAVVLGGCDRMGTAGVSVTMEEGPPTTDSTPGTAGAASQERQKLDHAFEVLARQATGIQLEIRPLMQACVTESQLIVHGTVTRVDPLHAPAGEVANPYIVFYVKPDEVLKGASRFGEPIPIALLAPGKEGAKQDKDYSPVSPVAEGDEVLVCSYRGDKDLPTGSGSQGAYFLWNDSYGLFLPADGEFVSALDPYTYGTLGQIRTTVGAKDTSTTLSPGYSSFEGKASRFEDRLVGKNLPHTLPFEVMHDAEWLDEALQPAMVTHTKAYRLANGDRVFLWRTTYPGPSWQAQEQSTLKKVKDAAVDQYEVKASHVGAFWYGEFGFVVIAGDYVDDLLTFGQMAETGAPLN